MLIEELMNEVEDWIMSRDNVQSNQEDTINLKKRFEYRLKSYRIIPEHMTKEILLLKDSEYKPKKRWLNFFDWSKKGNKTKTFLVKNKVTEDSLGEIKWDCGWRQYVFDDGEIKLAEGCLYELFEKIKELREERENAKQKTEGKCC